MDIEQLIKMGARQDSVELQLGSLQAEVRDLTTVVIRLENMVSLHRSYGRSPVQAVNEDVVALLKEEVVSPTVKAALISSSSSFDSSTS